MSYYVVAMLSDVVSREFQYGEEDSKQFQKMHAHTTKLQLRKLQIIHLL